MRAIDRASANAEGRIGRQESSHIEANSVVFLLDQARRQKRKGEMIARRVDYGIDLGGGVVGEGDPSPFHAHRLRSDADSPVADAIDQTVRDCREDRSETRLRSR